MNLVFTSLGGFGSVKPLSRPIFLTDLFVHEIKKKEGMPLYLLMLVCVCVCVCTWTQSRVKLKRAASPISKAASCQTRVISSWPCTTPGSQRSERWQHKQRALTEVIKGGRGGPDWKTVREERSADTSHLNEVKPEKTDMYVSVWWTEGRKQYTKKAKQILTDYQSYTQSFQYT